MSRNDGNEEAIQKCREILARLNALAPEKRGALDERFTMLLEIICEKIVRFHDGTISAEEFKMWTDELVRSSRWL
jgi:hypothetical protein